MPIPDRFILFGGKTSQDLDVSVQWNEILAGWKDPYRKPVVKNYGKFRVVRDDLLEIGSKARFADALFFLHPEIGEWVYGSSPAHGFAQVSLAAAAKRYGKRAVLFMAKRAQKRYTQQQITAIRLGATMHWVPNGYLTVTESRARKYVSENPSSRMLVPIGLDDPIILAAIIKVARSLQLPSVKEIWTVAGSGTLSRGLQMAFPDAVVHAVAVGHELTEAQRGRAKVWRHPLRFDQEVPKKDLPPYPSLRNYDAKLWKFVRKYGNSGALIWNVA